MLCLPWPADFIYRSNIEQVWAEMLDGLTQEQMTELAAAADGSGGDGQAMGAAGDGWWSAVVPGTCHDW